jgi:hypothetical protein
MTLLAGFQVLLRRHTGQEDLVVGTPTTGRTLARSAPLVGYFVNLLPLHNPAPWRRRRAGRALSGGSGCALAQGTKELALHRRRREAFLDSELQTTARLYRDENIRGLRIYTLAASWDRLIKLESGKIVAERVIEPLTSSRHTPQSVPPASDPPNRQR